MFDVLHGHVIEVLSGKKFVDGQRRVTVKFDEADHMYNEIRLRDDGLQLEETVALQWTLTPVERDTFSDGSPVTEPPPSAEARHGESREGG